MNVTRNYIRPIVRVLMNFEVSLVGELEFSQERFVTNFYSCISKEQITRELSDLEEKERWLNRLNRDSVKEATKNIFKLLITNKKLAIAEALVKT